MPRTGEPAPRRCCVPPLIRHAFGVPPPQGKAFRPTGECRCLTPLPESGRNSGGMASRYPPGGLANDAQQAAIHRPVGHDQHISPCPAGAGPFPRKNASNRVYNPIALRAAGGHIICRIRKQGINRVLRVLQNIVFPLKIPENISFSRSSVQMGTAWPFRKNLRRLSRPASEARQSTRPGEYNHIFPVRPPPRPAHLIQGDVRLSCRRPCAFHWVWPWRMM